MRRLSTSIAALLLTASVHACSMRPSSMWLEPGSTAQRVVLGLAEERGGSEPVYHLNYVVVKTCYASGAEQRTLWLARGEAEDEGVPTRIVYGELPSGFANEVAPQPLTPGCYEASVSGNGISATVRFTVQPDGSVVARRAGQT